jgi:VCBS repeat-containing protein
MYSSYNKSQNAINTYYNLDTFSQLIIVKVDLSKQIANIFLYGRSTERILRKKQAIHSKQYFLISLPHQHSLQEGKGMATTSTGIVYSNSGAAASDTYTLTEDSLFSVALDVMANDGGGAKTTLYSIDDGVANSGTTTTGGVSINTDLLTKDDVGAVGYSALGAKIKINADRTIQYDASSFAGTFQSLAAGEVVTDTFTYAIKMSNGTLAWTTVSVKIAGVNDKPTVAGALCTSAVEDGNKITLDLLSGSSDKDHGAQLHVELTDSLPAGVSLNGQSLTINPSHSAFQHLAAGAKDTIIVHYHVVDEKGGFAEQTATFHITGVNDKALIAGADTGAITEDSGDYTASGTLTVSDADDGENKAKASTQSNAYGTFSVDTDGHWTFTANNDALQALGEDITKTLSFSVDSKDGTGHHDVSIDLIGVNDDASIAGDDSASITEDSDDYVASGTLTVSDADDGESKAKAATQSNAYGTFSVDADGHWTFTANNDALQSLGDDITKTLTFSVDSKDGTGHHDVSIDLVGINDLATIAGDDGASVTEDSGSYTVQGSLTVADADDGESKAKASTESNAYGTFSVDADGHWTFAADNDALQALGEDVTKTLTFSVDSKDGSGHHDVSIDLIGVNDLAIIGGGDNASITEDSGAYEITGALSVNDLDQDESSFNAVTDFHSSYGTFSIDADGNWTYVLDNDNTDVAALDNTETLQDTITVTSADGTEKDILITINGHTDLVAASLPTTSSAGNDPNDNDTLTGGALITANNQTSNGADVGHGDANSQVLSLGGGNDVYYAGAGDDKITGDNGTDTIYGQQGTDTVSGNNQVDVLYGGSGNDIIDGGSGNDILYGGSGNDTIGGSADNDTIIGGYGADALTGDTGADTFVFLSLLDTNDTINDFQVGIDKLDLQAIYSGTLSFDSGHAGSGAVNANSVSFFAKDGNTTVIVDTDGNTATAEFAIKLTGSLSLTATDFLL